MGSEELFHRGGMKFLSTKTSCGKPCRKMQMYSKVMDIYQADSDFTITVFEYEVTASNVWRTQNLRPRTVRNLKSDFTWSLNAE